MIYHTKVYRKGDILARQGDICNRLVILTKGSVRGEMIDDSGRLIKVEDITAPRAIAPLFLFGNENRYPVEVTANDFDRELAATKDFVKIEGDKAIYATQNECINVIQKKREISGKLHESICQLCPYSFRQTLLHVF